MLFPNQDTTTDIIVSVILLFLGSIMFFGIIGMIFKFKNDKIKEALGYTWRKVGETDCGPHGWPEVYYDEVKPFHKKSMYDLENISRKKILNYNY